MEHRVFSDEDIDEYLDEHVEYIEEEGGFFVESVVARDGMRKVRDEMLATAEGGVDELEELVRGSEEYFGYTYRWFVDNKGKERREVALLGNGNIDNRNDKFIGLSEAIAHLKKARVVSLAEAAGAWSVVRGGVSDRYSRMLDQFFSQSGKAKNRQEELLERARELNAKG